MKKLLGLWLVCTWLCVDVARAQGRIMQIAYTPTKRAQVAIWIESDTGTFLQTILLTEAVGLRGIGNRPGAMHMNSGFRYPYGRREGVLPVWAHRRASAPGAMVFPRVIFQNRWEGYASRTSRTPPRIPGHNGEDSSRDDYFCLSFNDSNNDNVDATTCASVFNSDKGAFITDADVAAGYAEPFQTSPGVTVQRPLSLTSLYPMRRDVTGGAGDDGPDAALLASVARERMPEIDAVTRATAPADTAQLVQFTVPSEWPDGEYVVYVEVGLERDYNDVWSQAARPTPLALPNSWDSWETYGYSYRGQPSIVYRIPVHVSVVGGVFDVVDPVGYGDVDGESGAITPLDATITNDPTNAPGSGADRLHVDCGWRARVAIGSCDVQPTVPAVSDFAVTQYADEKHSHEWISASFTAVAVDGRDALGYQVKVSTHPITNETEFVQAEDAKATTNDFQGLDLCPIEDGGGACDGMASANCPDPGTLVRFDVGKLTFETRYYVAIRALGLCGTVGPIQTVEIETTPIHFTTVAPCFVATAAHGSAMAPDVRTLRRFRDDALMPSEGGRAFVRTYYDLGPELARAIEGRPLLRALARALLRPFVQAAALADHARGE